MLDTLIQLDIQLLNSIREFFYIEAEWFRYVILILADIQWILVAGFLVIYWLIGTWKQDNTYKITSLNIFYLIVGGFILYILLNQFLPIRERPELASILPPLVDHLPDNSFPSGHAIFAGASSMAAIRYMSSRWAEIVIVLGAIMCLCRVIAGVHFPGDILVGYIFGIAGASLMYPELRSKLFTQYLNPFFLKLASYIKL